MAKEFAECCEQMFHAMNRKILLPSIEFNETQTVQTNHPPQLMSWSNARRGDNSREREGIIIKYCPWCGKKLKDVVKTHPSREYPPIQNRKKPEREG